MSDSVKFENVVTVNDFVRTTRYSYMTYWWWWIATIFAAALMLGLLFLVVRDAFSQTGPTPSELFLNLGLAAFLGGTLWWAWTWLPKRMAVKSPHVETTFEYEFSSEGLISKSSLGEGRINWSVFTSAHETADYFILFSGYALFYPVPKRNIPTDEDLNKLRELFRNNILKCKLRNSKRKQ